MVFPFRVYVGAKLEEYPRVRKFYSRLLDAGFRVTLDWTVGLDTIDLSGKLLSAEDWRKIGEDEMDGVKCADIVVIFSHPKGLGLWIECGAALALGKCVVLVGNVHHDGPFFYLPGVKRVADELEAIRYLEEEVRAL